MKQYLDLYNAEVVFIATAQKFNFVSYSQKSIPTAGSMTKKALSVLHADFSNVKITGMIKHRDGKITIKTATNGNYQFFN